RIWLLLLLSFLGFHSACFAGQIVAVSEKVSGYLAMPEGATGKNPAVILIHEWWGLNDQIKGLAEELAANGFEALAVDLYRGEVTDDPMKAHELMRGLPDDRAASDLKSAVDFLQKNSSVDPQKIGVIGWCMGGGYALAFTLEEPRVQ